MIWLWRLLQQTITFLLLLVNTLSLFFLFLPVFQLLFSGLIPERYFGELVVFLTQTNLSLRHLLSVHHIKRSVEQMIAKIVGVSRHQVIVDLFDYRWWWLQYKLLRTFAALPTQIYLSLFKLRVAEFQQFMQLSSSLDDIGRWMRLKPRSRVASYEHILVGIMTVR